MSDIELDSATKAWLRTCDEVKRVTEAFTASLLHTEGETIQEHDRKLRDLEEHRKKLQRARLDQDAAFGKYMGLLELRRMARE